MRFPCFNDPKNGQPSISFTMMIITFVLTLIAMGLQMFKVVTDISSLFQLNLSCMSLYFLRKITFGGQTYDSSQAQQIVNKIEQEVK